MNSNQVLALLKRGDIEAAEASIQGLLRVQPDNAENWMLLSAVQHHRGRPGQAIESLLQAERLQQDNPVGRLRVATALRRVGGTGHARRVLQQLDSADPDVQLEYARLEWHCGNYRSAAAQFSVLAQGFPTRPDLAVAAVRAQLRLAEWETCDSLLQAARARWPENPELACLLARLRLDQLQEAAAQDVLAVLDTGPQGHREATLLKLALGVLRAQGAYPENAVANRDSLTALDPLQAECVSWLQSQRCPHLFGSSSGLLRWAVQHLPESGTVVECGVYHGFSLGLLERWSSRTIHGFDSFNGLPEAWNDREPAGSYSTSGQLPSTGDRTRLHPGWFEHTLPVFADGMDDGIALLHIDCDLYSSTVTVLQHLARRVLPGGWIIFDDFMGYPNYPQHEFRAYQEWVEAYSPEWHLQGGVVLGRAVAFRVG